MSRWVPIAALAIAVGVLSLVAALAVPPVARASTTTSSFSFTGGLQTFAVPAGVTSIRITADGAGGGDSSAKSGGSGAEEAGTFAVTAGEDLTVLVGGAGQTWIFAGGGGGGSFVYRAGASTPMIAAGGGGGGSGGTGPSSAAGGNGSTSVGTGSGGSGGPSLSGGSGGGGGGYSSDGAAGVAPGVFGAGGLSVIAGGAGGVGGNTFGGVDRDDGGFGGGGGGSNGFNDGFGDQFGSGGGGGGDSGGNGGGPATGGLSFNAGTGQTTGTGAAAAANGSVTIEYATTASSAGLGSSPNPSTAGTAVTFTASITGDSPTGTVDFTSNGTTISGCAAQPLSAGVATCTTSTLAAGSHSVIAAFGGDFNNLTSDSPSLTQIVRHAPSPPSSGPSEPGAPTAVAAVAGDQQATVSCAAPPDNGAAITRYTVTASPGGTQVSGPSCPLTLTGLSDGTSYTFTVTATNNVGTGAASTRSNAVTPTDTHSPTAPAALRGQFSDGALDLQWQSSTDNVGVDHYEIYLNNTPVLRVSGNQTYAHVRAFDTTGSGVYIVRAVDAAGNQSTTEGAITVVPVTRPSTPKEIPRWAWELLSWQEHHNGKRPSDPQPLPAWYAAWRAWRAEPFKIAN